MTDFKTAPVALKRGMPPEQKNGMFGAEDRLIALGVRGRFTAIVTVEVADIRASEADQSQFPLVEFAHIEPIWDADGIEAAREVQEEAYKERTGANQLNFESMPLDAPSADEADGEDEDEFDKADPKKAAKK